MADRTAGAEQAGFLPRFFRTGASEYGAGDRFLGVPVPLQRRVARSSAGLGQPVHAGASNSR